MATGDPAVFLVAAFAALNGSWVVLLWALHLYQISANLTTNESANSMRLEYLQHQEDQELPHYQRRFANPFDRGVLRNCAEFWRQGPGGKGPRGDRGGGGYAELPV
jgi:hypothetical protein